MKKQSNIRSKKFACPCIGNYTRKLGNGKIVILNFIEQFTTNHNDTYNKADTMTLLSVNGKFKVIVPAALDQQIEADDDGYYLL